MEQKKFQNFIISDREPEVGDIMVCVQRKNVCFGQTSEPVTRGLINAGAVDTKNWKVVINMDERRQQLVDEVIEELKEQFEGGDYTVLDELLKFIPNKNLIQALTESKWKQFKDLEKI